MSGMNYINNFKTYLISIKGYSQHTAAAYERDLRQFARYTHLRNAEARWSTITMQDVDAWIVNNSKNGRKPSTLCRQISSIAAFYRYLKREGYAVENPVKYESRPKVAKRIPTTIDHNTMMQAWRKTDGELHTIMTILITTGVRIQECLDITWDDIRWEDRKIIIHGKGGNDRYVYICDILLWELQSVARDKKWKLFPSWTQERVRREMFWVSQEFDNLKHFSPHTIRHTYATELAKMGANVTTIATLMGHQSIKTTQKYIDMTQMAAQQVALMYNPIKN